MTMTKWRLSAISIHHWYNGNDGVVWVNVHDQYVGEYFTASGSVEVGKYPSLDEAQVAVDLALARLT